jgi:hypothetical protein
MKKWRDIVGMFLIASGIGGVLYGVRAATGHEDNALVSTTCIGAGAMANFVAFRVMRDPKRAPTATAKTSAASSSAATTKRVEEEQEETTTSNT